MPLKANISKVPFPKKLQQSHHNTPQSDKRSVPAEDPSREASADRYIYVRLNRLEISCCTDVEGANGFSAQVISLFLATDTPWSDSLNVDLFVEDMVNAKTKFCSRLSVSSVLVWACTSLITLLSNLS